MPSSLINGWKEWDEKESKSAVVLIDEQKDFGLGQPQLLANQDAILQLVDQFQNAIACFVELNPANTLTWPPTNPKLTRRVSQAKQHRISKQHFSAFDDTTLYNLLDRNNVKVLVVMGHVADQCVKQSIFGGARKPHGSSKENTQRRFGAVDYDYAVLTSQSVVSGKIRRWPKHRKVFLFDHI